MLVSYLVGVFFDSLARLNPLSNVGLFQQFSKLFNIYFLRF